MKAFALYNLKGGVGKTAATINLAYLASKDGLRTLVWDLDPQGSASYYLDASSEVKKQSKKLLTNEIELGDTMQDTEYENLYIIPADLSARHADVLLNEMKQAKKKFASLISSVKKIDLLMLDSPPGISYLHAAIFSSVDCVLMPNIPTTLSIRSFETVMEYFKEHELETEKIKCFFSMVDNRKNLHVETMAHLFRDNVFFKNYIPYLSDVEKMGVHKAPVETYASNSYAAKCYRDLWNEIKEKCL